MRQSSLFHFVTGACISLMAWGGAPVLCSSASAAPQRPHCVMEDPLPTSAIQHTVMQAIAGQDFIPGANGIGISSPTSSLSSLTAYSMDPNTGAVQVLGGAAFEMWGWMAIDMMPEAADTFSELGLDNSAIHIVAGRIWHAGGTTDLVAVTLGGTIETVDGPTNVTGFLPMRELTASDDIGTVMAEVGSFAPISDKGYHLLPGPSSGCGAIQDCAARCDCFYNQCVSRAYEDAKGMLNTCLWTTGIGVLAGCGFGGVIGCIGGVIVGITVGTMCYILTGEWMDRKARECHQDWIDCLAINCGIIVVED